MHTLYIVCLIAAHQEVATEREALIKFLKTYEQEVLKRNFDDDLKKYEGDELKIRFYESYHGAELKTVDTFLSAKPGLTEKSNKLIGAMRSSSQGCHDMCGSMIKERRFRFTDEEKARRQMLLDDWQKSLRLIGKIIDGR